MPDPRTLRWSQREPGQQHRRVPLHLRLLRFLQQTKQQSRIRLQKPSVLPGDLFQSICGAHPHSRFTLEDALDDGFDLVWLGTDRSDYQVDVSGGTTVAMSSKLRTRDRAATATPLGQNGHAAKAALRDAL